MLEYIGFEIGDTIASLAPYQCKLPSWLCCYKAANQNSGFALGKPRNLEP